MTNVIPIERAKGTSAVTPGPWMVFITMDIDGNAAYSFAQHYRPAVSVSEDWWSKGTTPENQDEDGYNLWDPECNLAEHRYQMGWALARMSEWIYHSAKAHRIQQSAHSILRRIQKPINFDEFNEAYTKPSVAAQHAANICFEQVMDGDIPSWERHYQYIRTLTDGASF